LRLGIRYRLEDAAPQEIDLGWVVLLPARQELLDLQQAIASAKIAVQSGADERALGQRAQAVRGGLQRIECKC
jgi:hypothetical protein